jgi:CRISPR-associated protein Csb2
VRDSAEQRVLLARLAARREKLLRKAMLQAGVPEALVQSAVIESRGVGYVAGIEPAMRHFVPSHLLGWPRLHVRIRFERPLRGPLCFGSGRFYGIGLFAALPDVA